MMQERIKLALLALVCNMSAILGGMLYGWVSHLHSQAMGQAWGSFCLYIALSVAGSALIGIPSMLMIGAPIDRGLQPQASPAIKAAARQRSYALPITLNLPSLFNWLIFIVGMFAFFALFAPEVSRTEVEFLVVMSGVVAITATTNIFYAAEFYSRSRLMPRLGNDAVPLRPRMGVASTIRIKIGMLVVTTGAVPVVTQLFALRSNHVDLPSFEVLGVEFLLFGTVQAWFLVQSISSPVRALAGMMTRVAEDDLELHAPVQSTDEIGRMALAFNTMVEALRRGRFVKQTFGRYVTPAVMEEILGGKIAVGGERRRVTVLFSDIRGFTALSEKLTPEEVVRFLNLYLDRMVDVVVAHGGTVDKFVGDAVMANFGVPGAMPDHALRAVRCGMAMLAELARYNEDRAAKGMPALQIGIGIHTGEVVAGNIGSAKKTEYTVIGDTVNTASRVESLTKTLSAQILISDATLAEAGTKVESRPKPPVEVKGKSEPLHVHEVLRVLD